MSKILITGGAGFIASHLADYFIKNGHIVYILDNLLTGSLVNMPSHNNCHFHNVDINNYEEISEIFLKENFDFVYHYAAVVGVKRTLQNPDMVLKDLDGLKNIFELSVKSNIKKIFFSSSSEVYGEPVVMPQNETTTPLNSRLPYAVIKNIGECFCKTYYQKYNLQYNIFRFFNTYGKRQSPDFVISKFLNLAENNKDIEIYGDGLQSRTFCYIDDNIEATTSKLLNNQYNNQTINIGNDLIFTINDLTNLIIKLTNSKSQIKYIDPLKEGDMSRRQPDISKLKKILGRELVKLEQGLKKIIN